MNLSSALVITRKELRSYFLSPVAFLFLGGFLTVTLFLFFTYSKFFARNLADVRPLFEALPVLLIFLVAALTMRQWSEEKKMGTLEILMTLPVRTGELVLGKFFAGMILVALALVLTLPMPLTAWFLGPLDWGPVIGGYLAAFLLSAAYLAIGLCVSSRTDNQIVALMVTSLLCGLLYMVGADTVTGLFGNSFAELLRALGSGSRFASIQRGVMDVRDLAYYGSLTAFFLILNVQFIEANRLETESVGEVNSKRKALAVTVMLAGLNAVALNIWLAPVTSFRMDLTSDGEYSVSPATERILANLQEPLTITGYFSEKTHPLLAPLVPRIKNYLEEYQVLGHGKVSISFIDPNKDEEIEREINEVYSIKSVPFRVSSRHEKSVVNSYFHLLVRYGSEHLVLSFNDLIEVYADETDVQVRLKNLEYDLTRAIKKVSQGFQSIESVLVQSKDKISLTAYVTPDLLPKEYQEVPGRIEKIAKELTEKSAGHFLFQSIDPSRDQAMQQAIYQKYGIRPVAVDLFGQERFYLHMLLEMGDRKIPIFPQGELTEAALRTNIEAAIKRGTPGFLKTVALLTEKPQVNPQMAMMGMGGGGRADYQALEKTFQEEYEFRRLELKEGAVPGDVDVLIVAKPGKLDEKQRFAIDQFLMRGGAVIVLTGSYDVGRELKTKKVDQGLLDLLKAYGVEVQDSLVMDPQNARFPVPVPVKVGPFTMERVEMMPYPFFVDVRRDGLKEGHLALAGVPSVAVPWASPLKLDEKLEGRKSEVLLRSSPGSWAKKVSSLQPDFKTYPSGFPAPDKDAFGRKTLTVSLVGSFPSYFKDKPSPLFTEEKEEKPEGDAPLPGPVTEEDANKKDRKADRTGRTLKSSTPDARLVVIGSSAMAADMIASLDFRSGTDSFGANLVLMKNLVDWSLADTDLLQIRSVGHYARTLRPMTSGERSTAEVINYLVVLLALGGVAGVALTRRRSAIPLELV
jgi:ABC-2 type transport system permease protein